MASRHHLIIMVAIVCAWSQPCLAQDVLLQAVNFVLTGRDDMATAVVDKNNCVFSISRTSGTDTYFLNNIQSDRIFIQLIERKTQLTDDVYINEEIHGSNDVVLRTSYGMSIDTASPATKELDEGLRKSRPDLFTPHSYGSAESTLELPSPDIGRVKRAWTYIYTHGCVPSKSPF